jgi:hypothetical protein
MHSMNVHQWLEATNHATKGISPEEKERRKVIRARVIKKAGTSAMTLYGVVFRESIGNRLFLKLESATANEVEKITNREQRKNK